MKLLNRKGGNKKTRLEKGLGEIVEERIEETHGYVK